MAKWLVRFFGGGRIVRHDVTNGIPPSALEDPPRVTRAAKDLPQRQSKARAAFRMPEGLCDIHDIARLCKVSVEIIYVWRSRDKSFPLPVQGGGRGGRKARLLWDLATMRAWAKAREKAQRSGRR